MSCISTRGVKGLLTGVVQFTGSSQATRHVAKRDFQAPHVLFPTFPRGGREGRLSSLSLLSTSSPTQGALERAVEGLGE